MDPAPLSLVNRSQVFFQRFTITEVHANLSPGNNHLVDWCIAIQKTYDKYLKLHSLPIITYSERQDLAKKLGKTHYPGAMTITRAHIQLAEKLIRANIGDIINKEVSSNMSQLYITKDKEYVVRIGTNSANEAVVEEKSTGRIFAVDAKTLEKVLPYSVGVRFGNTTQLYHYLADKDMVAEGDVLFKKDLSGFARVTSVDTKNEQATTKLTDTFLGVVAIKAF